MSIFDPPGLEKNIFINPLFFVTSSLKKYDFVWEVLETYTSEFYFKILS